MKVYKQDEWTAIHDKACGGRVHITGMNLNRKGVMESVEVTTKLSGTLEAWGVLKPQYVAGIEGGESRQFHLEADGTVSLHLGCGELLTNRVCKPKDEFVKPVVIPFAKWYADYIAVNNFTHKREEDKFHEVVIKGVELNKFGIVKAINSDVTWEEVYGCFGRNTSHDRKIEIGRDILLGTYGLCRNDICDDWDGNLWGDTEWHCYLDENLDITYDGDDTKYYYNAGYNGDYFNKVAKKVA